MDFTYEVSRSLAACEGAILVVDASQGDSGADAVAISFSRMDAGLEIIPVLNKIDLPGAEPERREQEIIDLIGAEPDEILRVEREGRHRHPRAARGDRRAGARRRAATRTRRSARSIFDSYYDRYRGAIPSVRVVDGTVREGMEIAFGAASGRRLRGGRGRVQPAAARSSADELGPGEVGYVVANVRTVSETRAGDTILDAHDRARRAAARLPGRATRWCSPASIPTDTDQYEGLRDALEKLQLNDARLHYEPETSTALGFGFRCGFLGLLHMEIVQERLEREFDLDLVTTVPNVEYHVYRTDGDDGAAREPEQAAGPRRASTASRSRT